MEIRILNGGRGREINAAVLAAALNLGYKLTSANPFVRFEVLDWSEFLHICWQGFADFSRTLTITETTSRMHVQLLDDTGRSFEIDVWYSPVHGGIHYVSLY